MFDALLKCSLPLVRDVVALQQQLPACARRGEPAAAIHIDILAVMNGLICKSTQIEMSEVKIAIG